MQYHEDMFELVEDLPEELSRRLHQISKWDEEVDKYNSVAEGMMKKLESPDVPDDEKISLFINITEILDRQKELTVRKAEMAERTHGLLLALSEKGKECAFNSKLELEADSAGSTKPIEGEFIRSILVSHQCDSNSVITENEDPRMYSSVPLGGDFFPGMLGSRNARRKRSNSRCSSRAVSFTTSREATPTFSGSSRPSPIPGKDRPSRDRSHERNSKKRQTSSTTGSMSAYMRKKKEKIREQQKFLSAQAQRERQKEQEKDRLQFKEVKEEPPGFDLASFCANGVGRPPSNPSSMASSSMSRKSRNHPPSDSAPSALPFSSLPSSSSHVDHDLSDLLDIFPNLPSPDHELVDALGPDFNFDTATSFMMSDEKICGGMDESGRSPSPLANSASASYSDRKKNTSAVSSRFLNFTAGESLHGRQRKLTNRAEEMVREGEIVRKERARKRQEEVNEEEGVEEEDNALYCYCQQPSSGEMIACDYPDCRYQWFHFECLELAAAPEGQWFCSECSRR